MWRVAGLACAAALWVLPVAADEGIDRLTQALRLDDVVEILRSEGLEFGETLDQDMLAGEGGSLFAQRVSDIYAAGRMTETMTDALRDNMTPEQISQSAGFFETDLGQAIISLENSARRAISDETIEDMARAEFENLGEDHPRVALISEYIEVNDLIEQNVHGTLSSDYSFYRGLAAGNGVPRDDDTMLAGLLEGRDQTREETRDWLFGFLTMAYQPLSDAELGENIAFSRTGAGQALNAALFVAFDILYDDISYELGLAVAQAMTASDL